MSDTTFTDGTTVVDASWLNDINIAVYRAIGAGGVAPTTPAQVVANLGVVSAAQVQAGTQNYAADTSGVANTITLALTPVLTAYTDGMPIRFKAANTNTGATTLNAGPSGLSVTKNGAALAGGEIVVGHEYTGTVNLGASTFELVGQGAGAVPVGTPQAPLHAVQVTQAQTNALNYAVAAGTTDALTATLPAGVAGVVDGMPINIKLTAGPNTTTTPTLNVTIGGTATGAKTITKANGAALAPGDLGGAGAEAWLIYNSATTTWILLNPLTPLPIINNTGAASDITLAIGQICYIDIVAATSCALHVATGDHQKYELLGEYQGTGSTASPGILTPNNTTYTNFFIGDVSVIQSGTTGGSSAYYNGFLFSYAGAPVGVFARISTATQSKTLLGISSNVNSTGPVSYASYISAKWLATASSSITTDTTTAWTSLGTLTFPVATTGRTYVRRIA